MKGKVIRSTGSWYLVKDITNNKIYNCKLKGQLKIKGFKATNPVVVGDDVDFIIDEKNNIGIIKNICPRKNYIIRRAAKLSKESHIIAANIDKAFLIATLILPKTSTGFIDRFLVTANAYNIPVVIVFNKIDIYTNSELEQLQVLESTYKNIGYNVINVSAINGYNFDLLINEMKNNICLFAGHSGTGKTTLLNKIEPTLNLKTRDISKTHLKGRHTTSFAEMFPLSFGGYIIDTPGIKEFGLINIKKEELTHFFPEMFQLLNKCKYYNCTHVNEPGCAVKQALEDGQIASWRYKNYIVMFSGEDIEEKEWS
ncbi:MAG TPA: ribosome small subunit-dependent GTPase A [Bacteroidales bacterium]|nr:ribosome small subunit-dependent GTPase A [Bacteroidales bacterium]